MFAATFFVIIFLVYFQTNSSIFEQILIVTLTENIVCKFSPVSLFFQWAPTMECADQFYADASASQFQPAEYGKTELSLLHFTVCFLLAGYFLTFTLH